MKFSVAGSMLCTDPAFIEAGEKMSKPTNFQSIINPSMSDTQNQHFNAVLKKLTTLLKDAIVRSRIDYGDGLVLHTPDVSKGYKGIWPDDFLFPWIVVPELADVPAMNMTLEFLSDSLLQLPCVPDRVHMGGQAVMKPGTPSNQFGHQMPMHLPAAWTRLLDYFEKMGATIPRRAEWAAFIERSFAMVPFKDDLVYIDPEKPSVGFGFQDPCLITGKVLFASLILQRGFERAVGLFAKDLSPDVLHSWKRKSEGIKTGVQQLWDDISGTFMAGSHDGRQTDVWGNGLAYWYANEGQQERIVKWYELKRSAVFNRGFTRHIAEANGWLSHPTWMKTTLGKYTNGGFWPTGTGFVLPAIADRNMTLASELAQELDDNIEACKLPEWIYANGQNGGKTGFLMGMAMPALAIRSILENKALPNYL